MTDRDKKHDRKSIRLINRDYSRPGGYFITVCSHNKKYLFGNIINQQMELNNFGEIVQQEWLHSSKIRDEIDLDIFQIMPNHFHAIVLITDQNTDKNKNVDRNIIVGANGCSPMRRMRPKSLSSLMAGFQSSVTSKINKMRKTPGTKV